MQNDFEDIKSQLFVWVLHDTVGDKDANNALVFLRKYKEELYRALTIAAKLSAQPDAIPVWDDDKDLWQEIKDLLEPEILSINNGEGP